MNKIERSDVELSDLGLAVDEIIMDNPLESVDKISEWSMEGPGTTSFPLGRMRMESTASTESGQAGNLVLWCPQVLPDFIRISWDFYPIREPGLAILFFAASGREGQHVLDPSLAPRSGPYQQYHDGDINALHVSYFRRAMQVGIRFHTCNLRKSRGFHLVCQGADPIPPVAQADPPYRISVIKAGTVVRFCIDSLCLFTWTDTEVDFGPALAGGCIGFRQMIPLIAEYANLRVERLSKEV